MGSEAGVFTIAEPIILINVFFLVLLPKLDKMLLVGTKTVN